jgi:hypothetical protein
MGGIDPADMTWTGEVLNPGHHIAIAPAGMPWTGHVVTHHIVVAPASLVWTGQSLKRSFAVLPLQWDERSPSSAVVKLFLQWDEYGTPDGATSPQPMLNLQWFEVESDPILLMSWDELGDGLVTAHTRDRKLVSAVGTKTP